MTNTIISNPQNGVYNAHSYSQAYVGGKKSKRKTAKKRVNKKSKKKSRKSTTWYNFFFS